MDKELAEECYQSFKGRIEAIVKEDTKVLFKQEGNSPWYFMQITKVKSGGIVGSFYLSRFFGCCGLQILCQLSAYPTKVGLGTILNEYARHLSYTDGFSALICTDTTKYEGHRRLMAKLKWITNIFTFRNARTGNTVGIHVIKLRD